MATPLSDDRMLSALKAEGVRVYGYKSWRSHNRNHKGAWGGVNGVMIHHTVSRHDDSSVALCYNGHATLPGPLCHAVGRNDGRVALVSNGRANHAGSGDPDVLRAVINESKSLPNANSASTDGNSRFYGIEIVNMGDGRDTYTAAQYDQAVRWAAAICRAHGWSAESVIGHKEWQPGKIDPRGPVEGGGDFSMDRFRADVQRRLNGKAGVGSAPSNDSNGKDEDDMPSAEEIARAVLDCDDVEVPWESDNKKNQLGNALASMWRIVYRTEAAVEKLAAAQAATDAKVDALDLSGLVSALESVRLRLDVTE